jgi:hypothetical protein
MRFQIHLDVVPFLELVCDYPDMKLTVAGDEELVCVRVALDPDRGVFIGDPVGSLGDPVLVRPGLGVHGERDRGLGKF